jgi:hypothetical protein
MNPLIMAIATLIVRISAMGLLFLTLSSTVLGKSLCRLRYEQPVEINSKIDTTRSIRVTACRRRMKRLYFYRIFSARSPGRSVRACDKP